MDILQGLDNQANILDDVLLYSSQLEAHCKVLRRTLERAREKDLTFRLSKCMFAQTEVDYTGHVLTDQGVKVSTENVRAIQKMPEPQNKEDVRQLLGMATSVSKYKHREPKKNQADSLKESCNHYSFGESC